MCIFLHCRSRSATGLVDSVRPWQWLVPLGKKVGELEASKSTPDEVVSRVVGAEAVHQMGVDPKDDFKRGTENRTGKRRRKQRVGSIDSSATAALVEKREFL